MEFVNLQIMQLPVFLSDPPLMNQLVAERMLPATPNAILSHLCLCSLNTNGYLFGFAASHLVSDVVHQFIATVLDGLLSLASTPHLNAVLDEPSNQERRFILPATETVEHENQ